MLSVLILSLPLTIVWLFVSNLASTKTFTLNWFFAQTKPAAMTLLLLSVFLLILAGYYISRQDKAVERMFGPPWANKKKSKEDYYEEYPFKAWLALPLPVSRKVLLLHAGIPLQETLRCELTDEDLAVIAALLRDTSTVAAGER